MILNYPCFHICFPKVGDSTTMHFSIVSPEFTRPASPARFGVAGEGLRESCCYEVEPFKFLLKAPLNALRFLHKFQAR